MRGQDTLEISDGNRGLMELAGGSDIGVVRQSELSVECDGGSLESDAPARKCPQVYTFSR